jgi:hypothetical protein
MMSQLRVITIVAGLLVAIALPAHAADDDAPQAGTIGRPPAAAPPGSVPQGPPGAPPPLGAPDGVGAHPRRMTTLPGVLPGPPPPPAAPEAMTPEAKPGR